MRNPVARIYSSSLYCR